MDRLRPFQAEFYASVRKEAALEVKRRHVAHRATGGNTKDFRLRLECEQAVRDIMRKHADNGFRPFLRVSEDRKTSSIGTFFALSGCQPTKDCMIFCYILGNPVTGPNAPYAVVKSVENTLAATEYPKESLDIVLRLARRAAARDGRQVSVRISNGGEVPVAFLELLQAAIPTRILFSTDRTTRRLPDGLQDADRAHVVAHDGQALINVAVNFPMHGKGSHWTSESVKVLGNGPICPAVVDTLQNSPCGVTCFTCFPDEAKDAEAYPVVAWGFTKRIDVWQTYTKGR